MTGMVWPISREQLLARAERRPRYEVIAAAAEEAIATGVWRPGARLSTVREVAKHLRVSAATVAAAYDLLGRRGWIRGEVGRGTFVASPAASSVADAAGPGLVAAAVAPARRPGGLTVTPWRIRALRTLASRLRAAQPEATDGILGDPDPSLLPLSVLRRAWSEAIKRLKDIDLQYAPSPDPVGELVQHLNPRLEADGIPVREGELVVGSSLHQFLVLITQVVAAWTGSGELTIAVEEPGYPLALDVLERRGFRLLGVQVDGEGAAPASLDAALTAGASAALLTPRAQNPTGVSWSPRRRAELADVLADHPGVIAIEDDHFAGVATAQPGSLLADRRLEERVIYVRSFSKTVAPDLRVATAVARSRLRLLLREARGWADGWTSRLAQEALAYALADGELDEVFVAARHSYAARRAAVVRSLATHPELGVDVTGGKDGLHVWVHLPHAIDAADVVEQAAVNGLLVAPAEPFFVRPGRADAVRLNVAALRDPQAQTAGGALAAAIAAVEASAASLISV